MNLNDTDFATRLLKEENVLVLPGSAIGGPRNVFRIAFTLPEADLYESADRIEQFCYRYARRQRVAELMTMV